MTQTILDNKGWFFFTNNWFPLFILLFQIILSVLKSTQGSSHQNPQKRKRKYPKLFGNLNVRHQSAMSPHPRPVVGHVVLGSLFSPVICFWWLRAKESCPTGSCMKADSASPLWLSFVIRPLSRCLPGLVLGQCRVTVCTHWQWQCHLPAGEWDLDIRRKTIRRKVHHVVLKSLKTTYFYTDGSRVLTNNASWGIFEKKKDSLKLCRYKEFLPPCSTNSAMWWKKRWRQEFKSALYPARVHWAIGM